MFGLNGYLVGGVAAVFLAVASLAGFQTWRISSMQAEVAQAETARDKAQTKLEAANERSELVDEVQTELDKQRRIVREQYREQQQTLDDIRSTNDEVADYLSRSVPADLRRMHEQDRPSGSTRASQSDRTVPDTARDMGDD